MTGPRLTKLIKLAEAHFDAEFAVVRPLLQAEAECRANLARLDDMIQRVRSQSAAPGPMQLLGADVLFEQNVARQREKLNSELARILARKETAMDKVRAAFGRKRALELTNDRQIARDKIDRARRQRDAALAPWLLANLDR